MKPDLVSAVAHRARHLAIASIAVLSLCSLAHAQDVCATASTVNPASAPGLGGTGAPARNAGQDAVAGRPGIGGTGISEGGIGGTGISNGGIGGTGISNAGIGGTGIVGVITGFASICVNGVEVHYGADTPVVADGRRAQAGELAVGQVVAVSASGKGAQVAARRIALIHLLIGPVRAVDAATGRLEILGQAVLAQTPGDAAGITSGDWVQVSGYRLSSGEIKASRIERLAPQDQAQIAGTIDQVDAGQFVVNGTPVSLDQIGLPVAAAAGNEVLVRGVWDGSRLHAQLIDVEPTRQSVGRVDDVVFEGYVRSLQGNVLSVGNYMMTLAPDARVSGNAPLAIDQRVHISGRMGQDEKITVDRIEVVSTAGGPSGDTSSTHGSSSSGHGSSGSSGSQRHQR